MEENKFMAKIKVQDLANELEVKTKDIPVRRI